MASIDNILLKGMKEVARKTISPALTKSVITGKEYAKRVSPADTGTYVNSFEVIPAYQIGNSIVAELRNNDSKATGVEYGRRKTDSKWSKKGGSPVVEFGVGARVFQKANEVIKEKFRTNVSGG